MPGIASPIRAVAKFLERKQLADTVYQLKFEMISPVEIDFEPGQYIAIEIDIKTRRQYSISNSPIKSKNVFEIVIEIKPNGVGVNYLMNLKPGDEIKFIGQIGLFILPEDLAENLFFISTGTGLAPLKSMIETLILTEQCKHHKIYVYFGTRYTGDIFYEDLFDNYFSQVLINDYKIFLSRANMPGTIDGYVTQFIEMHDQSTLDTGQFFICGNGAMIKDVERELLERNISKDSIFYEKFY